MRNKKILIICLIICAILAMSVVSAAEVNIDDSDDTKLTTEDVTAVVDSTVDDNLTTETENVVASTDLSTNSLPDSNDVLKDNTGNGGHFRTCKMM